MKYIYKGRLSCLGTVEISSGFGSTPTTCIVSQKNSIEVEIKHLNVQGVMISVTKTLYPEKKKEKKRGRFIQSNHRSSWAMHPCHINFL